MEPDDLRGRFPMHALATAKAGSLGDERYISHSIWIYKCSELLFQST